MTSYQKLKIKCDNLKIKCDRLEAKVNALRIVLNSQYGNIVKVKASNSALQELKELIK